MRLLLDENFHNDILRGLRLRKPNLDVVRVQDVGLRGADDPTILEWAANEGRILLTHDVETMVGFAYERVKAGKPMPDVFELNRKVALGVAIDEILMVVEISREGEWEGQVRYLPLR
jgi:hypothetical protein